MGDQATKVAAAMSTGTAIALAIGWLNANKAKAAEQAIPEELMNLVIAIANSADKVDEQTLGIIAAINNLSLGGGLGWPLNANAITALRVAITPATGMRLPQIIVPSGLSLVIKAWPLNPAWLQIGGSVAECSSINQSFYLMPNEIVGYQVENANQIYIAAAGAVPGCFASLTVEQRKGGG